MATSVTATALPTYQELWRVVTEAWTRRTLRLTPEERTENAFHLAFMGLSARHIEEWTVIDQTGRVRQELIDDLNRFIRIWVTGQAA